MKYSSSSYVLFPILISHPVMPVTTVLVGLRVDPRMVVVADWGPPPPPISFVPCSTPILHPMALQWLGPTKRSFVPKNLVV